MIAKIISGGQTGVDRGALEAAVELGFPYGGMIPKHRRAEDGEVPRSFTRLEESARADYLFRTQWNVLHSDATLILARRSPSARDPSGLEGGTLKTKQFADQGHKPCLVLFTSNVSQALAWVREVATRKANSPGSAASNPPQPIVLNVAGPRESKCPGIQSAAKAFILRLLKEGLQMDGGTNAAACGKILSS